LSAPRKILIIRLHAIGDSALALPVCNFFRKKFPETELHFLTTQDVKKLTTPFNIFDNIYEAGPGFEFTGTGYGGITKKLKRLRSSVLAGLRLRKNRYDAVIDLQNNEYSRIIRRLAGAEKYGEFDRYAPKAHSLRIMDTFKKAGFDDIKNDFSLGISEKEIEQGEKTLKDNGWDGNKKIIVLNPAGLYITRMWSEKNYQVLGDLLVRAGYTLLIAGTEKIKSKAAELKKYFGTSLIDLTGKTAPEEIPGLLFHTGGIISDDSGLFHISWAMGKPGVLLLGATRADWTCQPGSHTVCLNSGDLECGNCMSDVCKYGDVRCLARYTPEVVLKELNRVVGES